MDIIPHTFDAELLLLYKFNTIYNIILIVFNIFSTKTLGVHFAGVLLNPVTAWKLINLIARTSFRW